MFLDKHIFIKRKCLTKNQCDQLINCIEQSTLVNHENIYYVKHCEFSSNSFPFLLNSLTECVHEYVEKHTFMKRLYYPWGIYGGYNLQKYEPKMSYYGEHMEHGKFEKESHRLLAWMIYLNTVRDGGGTCWPQQKFKSKARAGDLLIWPSGWTHSHYGIVSNTETKYIATGWCSFL